MWQNFASRVDQGPKATAWIFSSGLTILTQEWYSRIWFSSLVEQGRKARPLRWHHHLFWLKPRASLKPWISGLQNVEGSNWKGLQMAVPASVLLWQFPGVVCNGKPHEASFTQSFPTVNRALDIALKYGKVVKYFKTKILLSSKIHLDKESWKLELSMKYNPDWNMLRNASFIFTFFLFCWRGNHPNIPSITESLTAAFRFFETQISCDMSFDFEAL